MRTAFSFFSTFLAFLMWFAVFAVFVTWDPSYLNPSKWYDWYRGLAFIACFSVGVFAAAGEVQK